jgi:hypothetical protein
MGEHSGRRSGGAGVDSGLIAASSALEAEVAGADPLLLALASVASRPINRAEEWKHLSKEEHTVIARAAENYLQDSRRWLDYDRDEADVPARWAVGDAVTALHLRAESPVLADLLARPWGAAMAARLDLRKLGPAAEAVALRLAPTWHHDLHALVKTVTRILNP